MHRFVLEVVCRLKKDYCNELIDYPQLGLIVLRHCWCFHQQSIHRSTANNLESLLAKTPHKFVKGLSHTPSN